MAEQQPVFDLTPVTAAGLTQGEFAKLLGVSRVTVNMWFQGHHLPHKLLVVKLGKWLDLIDGAVKAGQLPLGGSYAAKDRFQAIRLILAKRATAAKS